MKINDDLTINKIMQACNDCRLEYKINDHKESCTVKGSPIAISYMMAELIRKIKTELDEEQFELIKKIIINSTR